MRIITIILLLLVTLAFVFADEKIDSLQIKLNSSSDKDKTAILNELAAKISPVSPQKAIDYANEALKLAEKFKQSREISNSYKNLADCYYYLYKIPESIEMYKKSAEIEKQIYGETSENYEKRLGDIGYCYELINKYEDAIAVYSKALKIAKKLGINEEIIALLSNIGQANFKVAKYDKALEFFESTLEAEQKFGKEEDLSIDYNNIGMVYDAWKQYEKAIEFYEQSLEIDRKYGDNGRIAIRLNNIGQAYRSLKKNDKALKYFQEALEIEKKYGREDKIAIRLTNIGLIYLSTADYRQALTFFEEAQKILENLNIPNYLSTLYNNIGHTYMLQKRYNYAEKFLTKSQKIALDGDLKQQQIYNYLEFTVLYKNMGKYKKAYQNQVAYSTLKDSVFTEEKHKQLAEFETKYETEKKEKEIEILKQESVVKEFKIKEQKLVKNVFIIGLILFGIISYVIFRIKQREIRTQKRVEIEITKLNRELEDRVQEELLKQQKQQQFLIQKSKLESLGKLAAGVAHEINQPLGGISMGLENLYFSFEEDQLDKKYFQNKLQAIKGYIERISQIINHIRIFSRDQKSIIFEKINVNEVVKNALSMIKTQYKKHNVQIELHLEEKIAFVTGNKFKLEQVIVNLLSNAKDALEEKDSITKELSFSKKITINSFSDENHIILEVEDNGNGIDAENLSSIFDPFFTTKDPEKGTGLGLSIIYGIINEMQGEISAESELGKFTKMIVKLPKV